MKRIGVVGLGLIGGSIALGVRRHWPDCEIFGVDSSDGPWPDGLLDRLAPPPRDQDLSRCLPECDLVVLAAPVGSILRSVQPALSTMSVVTDVGSTKRRIAAASSGHARAAHFVPGHPMTGAAQNGFEHASADLFEGATWFVCPEGAEPDSVSRVTTLIAALGGVVRETSPEAHDRAVALTSHLPQVLASALLAAAHEQHFVHAGGPAFERMTRGGGGAPSMWSDVVETNADFVAEEASRLAAQLLQLAADLRLKPPDISSAIHLIEVARRAKFDGSGSG